MKLKSKICCCFFSGKSRESGRQCRPCRHRSYRWRRSPHRHILRHLHLRLLRVQETAALPQRCLTGFYPPQRCLTGFYPPPVLFNGILPCSTHFTINGHEHGLPPLLYPAHVNTDSVILLVVRVGCGLAPHPHPPPILPNPPPYLPPSQR